jgi:hypothetical protein
MNFMLVMVSLIPADSSIWTERSGFTVKVSSSAACAPLVRTRQVTDSLVPHESATKTFSGSLPSYSTLSRATVESTEILSSCFWYLITPFRWLKSICYTKRVRSLEIETHMSLSNST